MKIEGRQLPNAIKVRLSGLLFTMLFILPVRFIGLSGHIGTEPNQQDFMVLKIGLISFLSWFSFLG